MFFHMNFCVVYLLGRKFDANICNIYLTLNDHILEYLFIYGIVHYLKGRKKLWRWAFSYYGKEKLEARRKTKNLNEMKKLLKKNVFIYLFSWINKYCKYIDTVHTCTFSLTFCVDPWMFYDVTFHLHEKK